MEQKRAELVTRNDRFAFSATSEVSALAAQAKRAEVRSFQMNERSRDIVQQKYGTQRSAARFACRLTCLKKPLTHTTRACSDVTMERLTKPTASYGKK